VTKARRAAIPDPIAFATEHPALVLALVSSAVVAFRVLVFADFRIATALAILSVGGVGGVILGSVIAFLPFVAPAVATSAWLRMRSSPAPPANAVVGAVLWVAAAGGLFLSFVMTPLVGAALFAGVALFYWWLAEGEAEMLLGVAAGAVIGGILMGPLWLPSERISVGSQTFTGYVLGESAGWTEILRPGREFDSRIVIVRDGSITLREICADPSLGTVTGLDAVGTLTRDLFGVKLSEQLPTCPPL
jgi:hypothetical protein